VARAFGCLEEKVRHDAEDGDGIGADTTSSLVGVVVLVVSVLAAVTTFALPIILSYRARRRAGKEPKDDDGE